MSQIQKKNPCHCINLRRAANAVTIFYDRVLEPLRITANQFSLLRHIQRFDDGTAAALAERVGVERSTVVRNLRPLLARGLIRNVAEDGVRNHQLRLTDAGRELIRQGGVLWEAAQGQIVEVVGKEALEEFFRILGRLEKLR